MAKMGHEVAAEGLYRRFGALVLRRARFLLGEDNAAEDALQEVFVRVLCHHDSFRNEAAPVTWLYRITTNYCFNVLRDRKRREEKLRDHSAPPPPHASHVETSLTVDQILTQLPADLCEIAVYHHVDRLNQDEIAQLLGVSRRTVGNRLKEFQCQAQVLLGDPAKAIA